MGSRIACAVVIGAACALIAGCGASPADQVQHKVQQFGVAIAHHDAKTICTKVFAPSLVKRFTSAGLNCERGLEIFFSGLHHPTLAVGSVSVHGSKASAVTLSGASGQTAALRPVELVDTSNGWRISSLGAPLSAGGTPPGATTTTTTKRTRTATTKRSAPKHRAAKKGSTSTKP